MNPFQSTIVRFLAWAVSWPITLGIIVWWWWWLEPNDRSDPLRGRRRLRLAGDVGARVLHQDRVHGGLPVRLAALDEPPRTLPPRLVGRRGSPSRQTMKPRGCAP